MNYLFNSLKITCKIKIFALLRDLIYNQYKEDDINSVFIMVIIWIWIF